jgi:hypothetical protein
MVNPFEKPSLPQSSNSPDKKSISLDKSDTKNWGRLKAAENQAERRKLTENFKRNTESKSGENIKSDGSYTMEITFKKDGKRVARVVEVTNKDKRQAA